MERKSRILIKALRHQPDILGLELDTRGWVNIKDVLKSLDISKSELDIMVSTNEKQRFEYNEAQTKIRASQGHSIPGIEVFKDWKLYVPTSVLYHGTSYYSVGSIMKTKLISKTRTHVHLSKDVETAINVGSRHGRPILLQIDAEKMQSDGYTFYESKNGVVLIEEIPSKYLQPIPIKGREDEFFKWAEKEWKETKSKVDLTHLSRKMDS